MANGYGMNVIFIGISVPIIPARLMMKRDKDATVKEDSYKSDFNSLKIAGKMEHEVSGPFNSS